MKIQIRLEESEFDIEVNQSDTISQLKQHLRESLENYSNQAISTEIEGNLVTSIKVTLKDHETIPKNSKTLVITSSAPLYLSTKSASILDLRSSPDCFEKWVSRAIGYCRDNNFEKFAQLKDEFFYTSSSLLKEKSFADLVNTCLENGWNCVHHVCKTGHSGILQVLIESGGECNLETEDGWTPLSLVSFHGFLLCTELLLNQSSIQVNKKTALKGTALHQACLGGNSKVVKLLMDANASPYIENASGQIPLQIATKTAILELIPKYIGVHFLNKYAKSEFKKPENYSGELFWTTPWQINDQLVVVLLDIETGVICHYDKKNIRRSPDLQVPISEVQEVQNFEELGVENRFFVHIRTLKESFKYFSKTLDVVLNWVQKIRAAVSFYQENSDLDLGRTYRLSRLVSVYNFEDLDFEEDDCGENGSVSFRSFEIIQEIGFGSFGTVFKVVKKDSGKRYAMKVLSKTELKRNNQLKYAVAECKILKKLDSPFIIPLFWAFQTPKNICMVFEFCPHGDLSKHIPSQGLSEDKARVYMSEVLLALEYLHSNNILYRDLKPANILIDETCHLKLTDFGLARENIHKSNLATTICGSPSYMAPEVLSNSGFWKPADVYSFGLCLFEVLSGRPAFEEQNNQKLFQSIANNKIVFPSHLSSQAKNLIQQLTTKNPEKRPSVHEIKNHGFFEGVKWSKVSAKQVDPAVWLKERNNDSEQVFLDDQDYSLTVDQKISNLY